MKALINLVVLFVAFAVAAAQDAKVQQPSADNLADLSQGKAIFVSRCASCHDENGNKKLADGTTLLARLAQSKDPEARLGTRLKNQAERHQVMLYMRSMLERKAAPSSAKVR